MKKKQLAVGPDSTRLELREKAGQMAVIDGDFKPLATDFSMAFKIPESEAVEFIREADEVLKGHKALGEAYLKLCVRIRRLKLAPKAVWAMLTPLGFHRVRIAEVNRVCQAPDEMFSKFQAKELGFKKTLQLTRGAPVLESLNLSKEEEEQAVAPSGEAQTNKSINYAVRVSLALKSACAAAAKLKGKSLVKAEKGEFAVNIGNGWLARLEVAPKTDANTPQF